MGTDGDNATGHEENVATREHVAEPHVEEVRVAVVGG